MAVRYMNGFDKYGTITSEYAGDFSTMSGDSLGLVTGRTGSGKAFNMGIWSANNFLIARTRSFTLSGNTIIINQGLKYAGFFASATTTVFILRNSGLGEILTLNLSPAGVLYLTRGGVTVLTADRSLVAGTWIHVAVKVVLGNGTAGSAAFQFDGVDAGSASSIDTINSSVDNPLALDIYHLAANGCGKVLDDLVICDGSGSYFNDWIGDRSVIGHAVTSDATPNSWTPSTGTSHFEVVNEVGPSATDYLSTSTDAAQELFGHAPLAAAYAGASDIAVQISSQAFKGDAGARLLKLIDKPSGGSISNPTGLPLSTTAQYVNQIIETDSVTGIPFTQAGFDALLVGLEAA